MRIALPSAVVALLAAAALSGCSTPAPTPTSSAPASATAASESAAPTSSTSPDADPFAGTTAVDPADFGPSWYNTDAGGDPQSTDDVAGVDFDSPDHTIHCGIYDPYFGDSDAPGSNAPFSGCVADATTFTWPVVANDGTGDIRANAVTMAGGEPSAAVWMSDVEFGGQIGDVSALPVGSSITWATVTCASLDDGVRCRDAASGSGFLVGDERYEADAEPPEQFDDGSVQDDIARYSVDDGYAFVTPSGNVQCTIAVDYATESSTTTLECGADEHPASGAGVRIVDDGSPQVLTDAPNRSSRKATVLAYGHNIRFQDVRCVSTSSGLTCENPDSRHGFTLSKSVLETH